MSTSDSDLSLAQQVRVAAAAAGCSPDAFLALAQAFARQNRLSVVPNFPPFPAVEEDLVLGPEHIENWPTWTAEMVGIECRLDRLRWPDSTVVTRLLDRRGLVLAAKINAP